MNTKGQGFEWDELKDIWINSPQTRQINIQVSGLIDELKGKMSQFEKDFIKSDLALLKNNWVSTKDKVSQFEKDSIKKDLGVLSKLFKRILGSSKGDKK